MKYDMMSDLAGSLGIEPRLTESKSVVLPLHHTSVKLVHHRGNDPRAYRLSSDCSTTELIGYKFWYRRLDSNQPHTDFQSAALPDELLRHNHSYGVSYEDRTHTFSVTARSADHYTKDTTEEWCVQLDSNQQLPG